MGRRILKEVSGKNARNGATNRGQFTEKRNAKRGAKSRGAILATVVKMADLWRGEARRW